MYHCYYRWKFLYIIIIVIWNSEIDPYSGNSQVFMTQVVLKDSIFKSTSSINCTSFYGWFINFGALNSINRMKFFNWFLECKTSSRLGITCLKVWREFSNSANVISVQSEVLELTLPLSKILDVTTTNISSELWTNKLSKGCMLFKFKLNLRAILSRLLYLYFVESTTSWKVSRCFKPCFDISLSIVSSHMRG